MPEPYVLKGTSTVLRGERGSDTPDLPDYNPYVSVIETCLPNAKIIVDHYHVIQNLYRKIEKTRKLLFAHTKAVIKALPDGEEKERKAALLTQLGKNVYLFKFGQEKLDEKEDRRKLLGQVCEEFSEFNKLRLLKEGFERIYDAETREEAEKRYTEWTKLIPTEEEDKQEIYAAIHTLRRSTEHWKKHIFAYFDEGCRYTNAATEGVNNFIDVIDKGGRSYGFAALRIKSLFNTTAADTAVFEDKHWTEYDFTRPIRKPEGIMEFKRIGYESNTPKYEYKVMTERVQISGGGVFLDKLVEELKKIL